MKTYSSAQLWLAVVATAIITVFVVTIAPSIVHKRSYHHPLRDSMSKWWSHHKHKHTITPPSKPEPSATYLCARFPTQKVCIAFAKGEAENDDVLFCFVTPDEARMRPFMKHNHILPPRSQKFCPQPDAIPLVDELRQVTSEKEIEISRAHIAGAIRAAFYVIQAHAKTDEERAETTPEALIVSLKEFLNVSAAKFLDDIFQAGEKDKKAFNAGFGVTVGLYNAGLNAATSYNDSVLADLRPLCKRLQTEKSEIYPAECMAVLDFGTFDTDTDEAGEDPAAE